MNMIELHAWNTPNGQKIAIMLEETELDYEIHLVNLNNKDQLQPELLRISPNNKIPAIIDTGDAEEPVTVFESGAILQYLAERSGRFLPGSGPDRSNVLQWLYWQVGGFGPKLGEFRNALAHADEMGPYSVKRFTDEASRLFSVLDRRLEESAHVGGASFSIADIAVYPFCIYAHALLTEATGKSWGHVARWTDRMALRPAVGRGMAAMAV